MASASDTLIFVSIVVVLLVVNLASATITAELQAQSTTFDSDGTLSQAQQSLKDADPDNSYTALKAISGVLLWSFGLLPAWLDLILLVLRATAYIILYKWIRGVSS